MLFSRTRSSKKIVAVADIGSASVAISLLSVHADGPAELMYEHRSSLPFEDRTEDATIKGIVAAMKEVGEKTLASAVAGSALAKSVTHCYAIINAPWARTKTVSLSATTPQDERVTSAMISELAQRAILSEKEFSRDRLIESSVVRVELNGYPTSQPVGKYAHRITVSALLSDCVPEIRQGIEDEFKHLFPKAEIVKRSGFRALISSSRLVPEISSDFVAIAVMGETTSIVVVRDGLASQHALVPEGIRSIVKRISAKGLQEETLSLLRMIERDECSSDVCDEISKSMAKVEIELARVFGENLTKIATPIRLPPDLVLITHDDLRPWLAKFFSRIDFTQCTSTAQPFSVYALSQQDLRREVTLRDDAALGIEMSLACALVNSEERS